MLCSCFLTVFLHGEIRTNGILNQLSIIDVAVKCGCSCLLIILYTIELFLDDRVAMAKLFLTGQMIWLYEYEIEILPPPMCGMVIMGSGSRWFY